MVGLPDFDFGGDADLHAADCGSHRRFQSEQEAADGAVRLHGRAGDGRDVLSPGRRISCGRHSVPDCESRCSGHRSSSTTRFLPDIAPPEQSDAVSSTGWGIGYLGGGLLLALNLALFAKAKALGLSESMAVRINLSSAGVWWALFSLIPLAAIRNRPPGRERGPGDGFMKTFREFVVTLRDMRHYPQTLRFLIAYLLYNDAVQAVITLAAQFGSDELKMPMADLTEVILMVQFVAFFGSFLFDWIAKLIGAKPAVIVEPADLDRRAGVDVCFGAERKAVLHCGGGGRDRAGRNAGAEPVAVLADDSQGPRGRVFRSL